MQKEIKVRLHLGCGKRILPGYTNIDIQEAPGVDVVCDVRDLPYEDNSVDFIYSCATIEHFGRHEWKKVLAHWFSKLKAGGAFAFLQRTSGRYASGILKRAMWKNCSD